MSLTTFINRMRSDNSGATAVEYGLIISLIVLAMVGALQGVATETSNTWSRVETAAVGAMTK
jgi:pilus assembly protein Flp/PilA